MGVLPTRDYKTITNTGEIGGIIIERVKLNIMNFWKVVFKTLSFCTTFFMFQVTNIYATSIDNSTLVTGTEELITDVTTRLLIFAPLVTVVLLIYFFIRRSGADEMDQKKWNGRIITAVISCLGAVLTSATLQILLAYYV